MIRVEDRGIVVAVAVQMFCARVQASGGRNGYSPDLDMCVGEAAALVKRVDSHIAPQERPTPMRVRRTQQSVELEFRSND